jgi:hypothetical protein
MSIYRSTTIVADTWYHVAIVFDGTNIYNFVDGVRSIAGTVNSAPANLSSAVYIGQNGNNLSPFDGWIDEFRVSKGIARWTSDFIVPNSAYPLSPAISKVGGVNFYGTKKFMGVDHDSIKKISGVA